MGDPLNKLPSTRVSHDDPSHIQLLTNIFGGDTEKAQNITNVCNSHKDIIVAGILFFAVNLPLVNTLITKVYANAVNQWVMAAVKTVIFTVLLFFILNSQFAKK
jgi:hypothetical protein